MRRTAWQAVAALGIALLGGCVERRMTILSDPPGALVTINGVEIGATPVDVPSHLFIYHGCYDIKLIKDGYEPLLLRQDVRRPWYQYFPIDFFAENVVPFHIKNRYVFSYALAPSLIVPTEHLLRNADVQRAMGQGIGPPPGQPPVPIPPP